MYTKLEASELVQTWYRENPANRSGRYQDNRLFQMLYKAYCRRSGEQIPWEALQTPWDYIDACARLFAWYRTTYELDLRMPAGGKGQKRAALPDRKRYTFHLRYSDNRSFDLYLIKGQHGSGSQSLLPFVLHTAVAFLVPPDELDEVLQQLGFHPLHVKNIHHLAIYYVLLTAGDRVIGPGFNPFDEVRELYLRAHEILAQPGAALPETYRFSDQLTRMIREHLFVNKALRKENFDSLVALNKDALNMRHSLILKDFHRLTSVFFYIFDNPQFTPDSMLADGAGEDSYSFYAFVTRYCRDSLTRKKYRDWLSGMIERNGKHPTREMMILLWLYAYCFAFLPGVCLQSAATLEQITKKLKKADPGLAAGLKSFCRNDFLDVYGLITGEAQRDIPQTFQGLEFIAHINEKLLSYGWGVLNSKLPFDHYIMQLGGLVIRLEPPGDCTSCESVEYGPHTLVGIASKADNVPCPLVVITQLIDRLKDAHIRNAAPSPSPLECSLYEQI